MYDADGLGVMVLAVRKRFRAAPGTGMVVQDIFRLAQVLFSESEDRVIQRCPIL